MILWDNSYVYATDPNKNVRVKRFPDEWMGSGWIEEFFDYKPFGELKNYVQSPPRFMFSSEEYMPETGMYHYLYRAYSPSLARFITRDPIEEAGGVNLYCFVNNNPISRWDIWGLGDGRENNENTYKLIQLTPEFCCDESKGYKADNCVYIYFYLAESKWPHWSWAENSDNNYISHAALGVNNDLPIGFNPKLTIVPFEWNFRWGLGSSIIRENRKDIVAKIKCCCFKNEEITAIKNYIESYLGAETYKGKEWLINTNNCATFVYDALANKGENPIKVTWDSDFLSWVNSSWGNVAMRPEELRRGVMQSRNCKLYEKADSKDWSGSLALYSGE